LVWFGEAKPSRNSSRARVAKQKLGAAVTKAPGSLFKSRARVASSSGFAKAKLGFAWFGEAKPPAKLKAGRNKSCPKFC